MVLSIRKVKKGWECPEGPQDLGGVILVMQPVPTTETFPSQCAFQEGGIGRSRPSSICWRWGLGSLRGPSVGGKS